MSQEQKLDLIYSEKQKTFNRYLTFTLIDLVVLGLFAEYWDHVVVESFTIAIIVAIILQVLLKFTISIEHRVSDWFNTKPGKFMKTIKFISLWAILFVSKLVILEAISVIFGDKVQFKGAWHGVIAFIAVITVMLIAEQIVVKILKSLER